VHVQHNHSSTWTQSWLCGLTGGGGHPYKHRVSYAPLTRNLQVLLVVVLVTLWNDRPSNADFIVSSLLTVRCVILI